MTPEQADAYANRTAAYVHIPFCRALCPYCDFTVVVGCDDVSERYAEAVLTEIEMSDPWRPLDAVYFGGGTPSHVEGALLGRILEGLAAKHGLSGHAEISLEANPEDFTVESGSELRRLGFNRISFGSQSLDDGVLLALGRRHNSNQVISTIALAREAGFANVSVDLIYGEPSETDESWSQTLAGVIEAGVDHLSCYSLTVEPGTELGRLAQDGAETPDPDIGAERFETAEAMIPFDRYEVSNWARPGFEASYNMTVWAQGEYEAYGNGACGHRNGTRFRNTRRLDAYLNQVESGSLPRAGGESISGWDAEIDRLFVGLRRAVGVANGPGTLALLGAPDGCHLEKTGVITTRTGRLIVTRPLLTDAVTRAVLALKGPNVLTESNG